MNFLAGSKRNMERLAEVYLETKKERWRVKEMHQQRAMLEEKRFRVEGNRVGNLGEIMEVGGGW
jgi:hypothetical protein